MKAFSASLGFASIYKYRELLMSLVKRDIESKYRASMLGNLWVVINPLMMLGVYTFVFGVIYRSRWAGGGGLADFVPMLYCGLIVHAIFSETVTKAPNMIAGNQNYVKKVVFPLELLPVSGLMTALFNGGVSFILLLLLVLLFKHALHWTLIFLPFVLLPMLLFAVGFAWLVAALGVFFRDIEQFIGILMSILLFLSPVFYSAKSAPALAQRMLEFNPLTYPIEGVRTIIVLGHFPEWGPWIVQMPIAVGIAWAGLWVFERARPAFADVV